MVALFVVTAVFQFLAAAISLRFLYHKRIGPHWSLVTLALFLMGILRVGAVAQIAVDGGTGSGDITIPVIEFSVSFLLAAGFALTERWFTLKERLEHRFKIMAGVDQAVIGILEEERILSLVCEGLTSGRGYPLAWIGAGDPDGRVRVARSDGSGKGILSRIAVRWDDVPEGQEPTGKAIRSGNHCVMNRVRDEAALLPWKSAFEAFRIRSAASFPIRGRGMAPMALTLYGEVEDAFDPLEVEALKAMASRIETAILSARRHEMFVSAKIAYDDLLRTQRDGVILVRGGRIVRVNPAGAALLGYSSAGELAGKEYALIFPPEVRDVQLALMERLAEKGNGDEAREVPVLRRDGSVFPCELTVTWVPRGNRNEDWEPLLKGPLGMILLRDVTQRKQAMEDLRAERDFSSRILKVAGVLVIELGPGGEILLFNRMCEETTGLKSEEVMGRCAADLMVPAEHRLPFQEMIRETWNGEEPRRSEHPILDAHGKERSIMWNAAVLSDAGGKTSSVLAVGTDVTERRRLEGQVVAMQKLEAVGTLAGGVAHDFNNILTGILGNLDLVRRSLGPESSALLPVQESILASERAAQLVRQLLEFSRRSPIDRDAVDVGSVIEEVVHLFSKTIDRRISVDADSPPDLWPVAADSGQLHQVLMNLCVNARDALMECMEGDRKIPPPPGGFRIKVSAENAEITEGYLRSFPYARKGEFVLISVVDNGVGMDEETRQRVFEPFFTTKKMGRGTGLGLSTVFGIVKQHAGWINVESRRDEGSAFQVCLPRAEAPPRRTEPAPEELLSPQGMETILLADDEQMIRDLGRQILEIYGYTVLCAADGQQAIDMFVRYRKRIDIVLLDLSMPRLSGLEVLERIRKLDPGARVIISSGYQSEAEESAGKALGACAFLAKPYRADLLAKKVREALDFGRSRGPHTA